MKIKRLLFVLSILLISGVCYYVMNQSYDQLARYPYVNSENHDIILEHLNTEDINYLCAQQIKPEVFLPYINQPGFTIRNAMYYDIAKKTRDDEDVKIVAFMNSYKEKMPLNDVKALLTSYTYEELGKFYTHGDTYLKNATLIPNPYELNTKPSDSKTMYSFTPNNLVSIVDIPHASASEGIDSVQVRSDVIAPLQELCDGANSINGKTCGDMIVVNGYISYIEQIKLYEKALLQYGVDSFKEYQDYPGRSEFQSGLMVRFDVAGEQVIDENGETPQSLWLAQNAYKYGFIVRFPKDGVMKSGKLYQPYTLRYVGKKQAKKAFDNHLYFEDLEWKK
ncbi:MAG: M15 family metallopeptidase [Erysipelotrichaceae bacterium]